VKLDQLLILLTSAQLVHTDLMLVPKLSMNVGSALINLTVILKARRVAQFVVVVLLMPIKMLHVNALVLSEFGAKLQTIAFASLAMLNQSLLRKIRHLPICWIAFLYSSQFVRTVSLLIIKTNVSQKIPAPKKLSVMVKVPLLAHTTRSLLLVSAVM